MFPASISPVSAHSRSAIIRGPLAAHTTHCVWLVEALDQLVLNISAPLGLGAERFQSVEPSTGPMFVGLKGDHGEVSSYVIVNFGRSEIPVYSLLAK